MILQEVMITFSIGSTVAVQWEDGRTVVGRGDHNNNRFYVMRISKTGLSHQKQQAHQSNTYYNQTIP